MKKLLIPLIFYAVFSSHTYAEDVKCGCDEVPFKPDPPCVKACIYTIIKYSDFNKLTTSLNLNDEQSYSVSEFRRPTPKDNATLETASFQRRNLREVESKLVTLPDSRLEKLIITIPAAKRTILIPADEIEMHKPHRAKPSTQ